MSSIRSFCVRWLAAITIVAGVLAPVSQAMAADHRTCPATPLEAASER